MYCKRHTRTLHCQYIIASFIGRSVLVTRVRCPLDHCRAGHRDLQRVLTYTSSAICPRLPWPLHSSHSRRYIPGKADRTCRQDVKFDYLTRVLKKGRFCDMGATIDTQPLVHIAGAPGRGSFLREQAHFSSESMYTCNDMDEGQALR